MLCAGRQRVAGRTSQDGNKQKHNTSTPSVPSKATPHSQLTQYKAVTKTKQQPTNQCWLNYTDPIKATIKAAINHDNCIIITPNQRATGHLAGLQGCNQDSEVSPPDLVIVGIAAPSRGLRDDGCGSLARLFVHVYTVLPQRGHSSAGRVCRVAHGSPLLVRRYVRLHVNFGYN